MFNYNFSREFEIFSNILVHGFPDDSKIKGNNINIFNKLDRPVRITLIKNGAISKIYDVFPKITTEILIDDESVWVNDDDKNYKLPKEQLTKYLCITDNNSIEKSGSFIYDSVVNKTLKASSVIYIPIKKNSIFFIQNTDKGETGEYGYIFVILLVSIVALAILTVLLSIFGCAYLKNVLDFCN